MIRENSQPVFTFLWNRVEQAAAQASSRSPQTLVGSDAARPGDAVEHAFEERAFIASIVESSNDSIIGTNMAGQIVSWNRGSERMWGYTAEEAIGRHITLLFLPELRKNYTRSLDIAQAGGTIEPFETKRVRKDGSLVEVSVIVSPIRNRQGELLGASGIYRDITELQRAKEAAEAAARTTSAFLATMTHELRTPLNGMIGLTDFVLTTKLDEEQRDCLETACGSAKALLEMVNDILDYSKIEAGMLRLKPDDFPLHDLVHEVAHTFALSARTKGIELTWRISPEIPMRVVGDALRLRQVLVNLIGNAVKFTHAGSVAVQVDLDEASRQTRFTVRDTGIGIAPGHQSHIFEAFRQADDGMARKYGGTGLGLSICKRLVELMSGRLWVESEPGRGSLFAFTIPLPEAASSAVPGRTSANAASPNNDPRPMELLAA